MQLNSLSAVLVTSVRSVLVQIKILLKKSKTNKKRIINNKQKIIINKLWKLLQHDLGSVLPRHVG